MSELERIFKENGGYFAEKKLGEIFESFNGNFDIKKEHINWKWYFVITAWLTDNWILWKTDIEAKIFPKNTITIDMFGFAFFRNFQYKMVTHARVFALKSNFEMTEWVWLYITSAMHFLNKKFWYSNMCSWAKIQDETIILPLDKNWNIAFDYMENYIRFLEAERIEELEAYLLATGLKDYNLNDREKSALEKFENSQNPAGGGYNIKKFCLKDIFDINPTKYYKFKNDEIIFKNWKIPLVSNSSTDNWIMWFSNLEPLNKWNTITCSDTTVWADTMFYQKDDFIGYSHIQHFVPKNILKNFSKKIALYIIPLIRKSTENKYDYWIKFNREAMNKTEISLPILWENIDLEFMENFIKAVEKLVIKDLVIWNEKKLSAYRQVIQK